MASSLTFPELRGNFTPVPDVLFDVLLKAGLSREELIVTFFLVHAHYEFEKTLTLVPFEAIVSGTDLDQTGALKGLRAALARGTVLQFHTDSHSNPRAFYLLNTDENLRVMGPMAPAGKAGPEADVPVEPAAQAPAGPAVSQDAPPAPPTPNWLAWADEAAPAPPPPAPTVSGMRRVELPPPAPALPLAPAGPPSGAPTGLTPRFLSRIVQALGRDLTKDERERLEELHATEALLMRVMDSLEARQVELYSSDLVIYEYESLQTSVRRSGEDDRRRTEISQARQRQRTCKKCNGLGYVFIGVNVVEECVCRKSR
ncbi:MAG: hypothetical protein HY814_04715 [Candidatus Riflebacteria bacterium]|nr:hypothetical protein [Candidatus Riflebacteria bacterium]